MFEVQPVRSKELQKSLAEITGCQYHEDCYAFFAGELSDDATEITSVIGLCQFLFGTEKCVIRTISAAPGCFEDEAIFIMVRTAMNWVYRADIPYIAAAEDCAPLDYIKKLGFRKNDGEWLIDLKKFYRSPCHYNADENSIDNNAKAENSENEE